MQLPLYQVDAFTRQLFGGNPAALVPMESWPDDALMQAIAAENNLAETAFFVPVADDEADYRLRWFTPTVEVDLCGHATLATAWLLFHQLAFPHSRVRFITRSGVLSAQRSDAGVTIDLPARPASAIACPPALAGGLGVTPQAVYSGANLIAVFDNEAQISAIRPDFPTLASLHPQGVIVTAPGDSIEVVSRFFGPSFGINEDPVTGSAHADLAPYWCQRLGCEAFEARQLSARQGELSVRLVDNRVLLTGQATLYMQGQIGLPDTVA